jgi:hypothetical protein
MTIYMLIFCYFLPDPAQNYCSPEVLRAYTSLTECEMKRTVTPPIGDYGRAVCAARRPDGTIDAPFASPNIENSLGQTERSE